MSKPKKTPARKSKSTSAKAAKPKAPAAEISLDATEEIIDVSGSSLRGWHYTFMHKERCTLNPLKPGSLADKGSTPATFVVPAGATLRVTKSYELLIDGEPVRSIAALVADGKVKMLLHTDEREAAKLARREARKAERAATKSAEAGAAEVA